MAFDDLPAQPPLYPPEAEDYARRALDCRAGPRLAATLRSTSPTARTTGSESTSTVPPRQSTPSCRSFVCSRRGVEGPRSTGTDGEGLCHASRRVRGSQREELLVCVHMLVVSAGERAGGQDPVGVADREDAQCRRGSSWAVSASERSGQLNAGSPEGMLPTMATPLSARPKASRFIWRTSPSRQRTHWPASVGWVSRSRSGIPPVFCSSIGREARRVGGGGATPWWRSRRAKANGRTGRASGPGRSTRGRRTVGAGRSLDVSVRRAAGALVRRGGRRW